MNNSQQHHIHDLASFLWGVVLEAKSKPNRCIMCLEPLDAQKERWGSSYCRSCYEDGC